MTEEPEAHFILPDPSCSNSFEKKNTKKGFSIIEKKENNNNKQKKNHKLIYIVSEETEQAHFLSPR